MTTVQGILDAIERIAPARFAYPFDKVGLQVGDPNQEIRRGVVSMDRSLAAIRFAIENGAHVLVCHHPLIWEPLSAVRTDNHAGRAITELVRAGIAFIGAHTNWDCASGGINDTLSAKLGLHGTRPFGTATPVAQSKVVVFAPEGSAGAIIDAASKAGAGRMGLYTRCAFVASGTGTFMPGEGSKPTIGSVGETESASESRIEMIVPRKSQAQVERAVRSVHPYEEPAIEFFQIADLSEQPIGRIGSLAKPQSLRQFAADVDGALDTRSWTWGEPNRLVSTVAVCGGAADDEWESAMFSGADVLVTGEVKQHVALEASESGFCLIAAGHYATENPGSTVLRDRLAELVSEVEWLMFEPKAGDAGRPLK